MNHYLVKVNVKIHDSKDLKADYRPIRLEGLYSTEKARLNKEDATECVKVETINRLMSQKSHKEGLSYEVDVREFRKQTIDFSYKN